MWVEGAWHSGAPNTPGLRKGPFLFVSGAVPIDLARLSEQMLRANGVPVETFYGNFGHWITPEGVAAGTHFLQRIFA